MQIEGSFQKHSKIPDSEKINCYSKLVKLGTNIRSILMRVHDTYIKPNYLFLIELTTFH